MMNNEYPKQILSCKNNPFSDIEVDIRTLMKRCGILTHELNELQNKWELNTKKLLLEFIGVADAFENRFREIKTQSDSIDAKTKSWLEKFLPVYKLLLRALKSAGVTPIETIIGEKANPFWHNVSETVEREDLENETIVEEIKKGYIWKGKLLRAADIKAVRNQ